MRDILFIASYLKEMYDEIYEIRSEKDPNRLTEMKLHKLLYFAQKTHYTHFGEWLFNDDFEGWKHGPVNVRVRNLYPYFLSTEDELSDKEEYTLREVIYDFGELSAWELRKLSH
ncbi:MAG: type II toxin-antitoxin system antitoxin SocA domain-containing protein, partial [Niallia sp.]